MCRKHEDLHRLNIKNQIRFNYFFLNLLKVQPNTSNKTRNFIMRSMKINRIAKAKSVSPNPANSPKNSPIELLRYPSKVLGDIVNINMAKKE